MLGSEHRDIRIPILADEHRAASAAIGKGERNLRRLVNHMAIGQDQAIGSKYETGARTLLARPIGPARTLHVDFYQRSAHPLDRLRHRAGVVVQQIGVVHTARDHTGIAREYRFVFHLLPLKLQPGHASCQLSPLLYAFERRAWPERSSRETSPYALKC